MQNVGWCKLVSLSIAESLRLEGKSNDKVIREQTTSFIGPLIYLLDNYKEPLEPEPPGQNNKSQCTTPNQDECCNDKFCQLKIDQAKKELLEANERIQLLKQKIIDWKTFNKPLPPTPPGWITIPNYP